MGEKRAGLMQLLTVAGQMRREVECLIKRGYAEHNGAVRCKLDTQLDNFSISRMGAHLLKTCPCFGLNDIYMRALSVDWRGLLVPLIDYPWSV